MISKSKRFRIIETQKEIERLQDSKEVFTLKEEEYPDDKIGSNAPKKNPEPKSP